QLNLIYNDAWCELLDETTHPSAFGMPLRHSDSQISRLVGPMLERAMARGRAIGGEDQPVLIRRSRTAEEVYLTLTYAAIRDAQGAIVGVQAAALDTTRNVVAERRMRVLHTLAALIASATT